MQPSTKLLVIASLIIVGVIGGGIVYASYLAGTLSHDPDPHSTSSTADIVASPTRGTAPLSVRFEGPSMIGESHPYYRWDFGDGTTGQGRITTHTFQQPGVYTVTMTAILDDGSTQTASITITVEAMG